MFWAEIWTISVFLSENFQFLEVKFSIYLNRRVFVMASTIITDKYFSDTYLPGTFILSSQTKNVSKLFSPANRVRVGHWCTWIWRVQGLYESADGQSAIRDGMYARIVWLCRWSKNAITDRRVYENVWYWTVRMFLKKPVTMLILGMHHQYLLGCTDVTNVHVDGNLPGNVQHCYWYLKKCCMNLKGLIKGEYKFMLYNRDLVLCKL